MMPEHGFLLVTLGFIVSLLSGFFGVGGGFIITPTLNIFGMAASEAVGTDLAFILGTSLLSAWKHRQHGHVELRLGLTLGIFLVFGVYIGKTLMVTLERTDQADPVIRILFIFLLGGMSLFMIRDAIRSWFRRNAPSRSPAPSLFLACRWAPRLALQRFGITVSIWPLAAVGFIAGILAGLLGVGGGILLIPVMVYLMGLPMLVAVGTSLVCVGMGSLSGVVHYAFVGKVHFATAGAMLLGAVLGAPLGVKAGRIASADRLKFLYGLMLMGGAASVAFKQAGWNLTAQWTIVGSATLMAAVILVLASTSLRKKKPGEAAIPADPEDDGFGENTL